MANAWTTSAQDADPVSWFTGPRMPVVFSAAAAFEGAVITIAYWGSWSSVVLQFVALPFFLGAGFLTARSAQPNRPRFRFRDAAGILALACAGLVVSAIGTYGGSIPVGQSWPAIAVAATFVSIAPYCTPRKQLICSVPLVAFVGVIGWVVFSPQNHFWPNGAIVLISVGPVLIGAVGSVLFSYTFVSRTLTALALDDSAAEVEREFVDDEASEYLGVETVVRVGARVAPFLESVAAAGVITPENRALAAQIARRLRADLVSTTSRSWLDVVALENGMIVSDPERLADSMNESQRAALQGLFARALDDTAVDRQTLLIELREQLDGSTAVALSIDVNLPEGRRLVLLAPYYLTLKTTVDDLSWHDRTSGLLMRFRIPPA